MKNISMEMFGELVVEYFEPLAQKLRLRLERLTQGMFDVFEIAGSDYFIRIRRGIGHNKIFFVTLSRR